MQRLQDRIAVITGAGSGIGLASLRRLAAEGATVVAVDVDEAAGKRAADDVGGLFVHADVTDSGAGPRDVPARWWTPTGRCTLLSTTPVSRHRTTIRY